jgi:hypothetical protein
MGVRFQIFVTAEPGARLMVKHADANCFDSRPVANLILYAADVKSILRVFWSLTEQKNCWHNGDPRTPEPPWLRHWMSIRYPMKIHVISLFLGTVSTWNSGLVQKRRHPENSKN